MAATLVSTQDLGKDYHLGGGVIHALSGVTMEIEAGEFVAIMGPSGSGKSTIMNLMGCLDTPSSGRYVLDGVDVSGLDAAALAETRNRKVGFVFQTFNLLARTTALENVELPLMYAHLPRRERRERATEVMAEVGLSDRMDHLPSQLSGGQQQRVAIARALVNRPALILADEPTGALDTRTGTEIMALFQKFNQAGMTVIVVTHEAEIARFAGRAMLFRDGKLTGIEDNPEPASAEDLLARMPAAEEVAA